MERRYGLSAVEGRAKKAAMPGLTRAETEKARRTGRDEAERAELARVVRAAATFAGSEPSPYGSSGTPGWRPRPVTTASAGIA
jgi:hypothetical protein